MNYEERLQWLLAEHEALLSRKNEESDFYNGIYVRYQNPVLTAEHTPLIWRYDLDPVSNPYLMERIGVNATMNSGAIKWQEKYLLVVRVEGADRKSFLQLPRVRTALITFDSATTRS